MMLRNRWHVQLSVFIMMCFVACKDSNPTPAIPKIVTTHITWNLVNLPSKKIFSAVVTSDDGLLLSTSDQGLLLTKDNGSTWQAPGIDGNVYSLIKTPSNTLALRSGVGWRSVDGGNTWSPLAVTPPYLVNRFVSSPDGKIIVGYCDWCYIDGHTNLVIYHSDNGAEGWKKTSLDWESFFKFFGEANPLISKLVVSNKGELLFNGVSSAIPNHSPNYLLKLHVADTLVDFRTGAGYLGSIPNWMSSQYDNSVIDYDTFGDTFCKYGAMITSAKQGAGVPSYDLTYGQWYFALDTTAHPVLLDPAQFHAGKPTAFATEPNRNYICILNGDLYLSKNFSLEFEKFALSSPAGAKVKTIRVLIDSLGKAYLIIDDSQLFFSGAPI